VADAAEDSAELLDPVLLLESLVRHQVRFVVIGGIAAIAHGYPLPTEDVDVTPSRDRSNLERLARALRDLGARLRSASDAAGVPFPIDADMLGRAESWALRTRLGDLDIVFAPTGTQGFDDLSREAVLTDLGTTHPVRVLLASLADVIRSKEAANREKDRAQLPALRRTLEIRRERQRRPPE
jgi:hypothetical protein